MKLRVLLSVLWTVYGIGASAQLVLVKKLDRFTSNFSQEYASISSERRNELSKVAELVSLSQSRGEVASIVFTSENNASISQLSQAWMQVAIEKFNLKRVQVYSAGMKETAISKSAVNALKSAGFKISDNTPFSANPRYLVSYSWDSNAMLMFSKKADNFQIPTTENISINVDESLNSADNADARSKQIAVEMFFLADKIQSSHMLSLQR